MTLNLSSRAAQCTDGSPSSRPGVGSTASTSLYLVPHLPSPSGPEKQRRPRAACSPPQCSYIPDGLHDYPTARADVERVRANFHEHRVFRCFSTTRGNETSALYRRLHGPQALLVSLFWPTFLLTGGLLVIAMVKLNRSLSILAAQR